MGSEQNGQETAQNRLSNGPPTVIKSTTKVTARRCARSNAPRSFLAETTTIRPGSSQPYRPRQAMRHRRRLLRSGPPFERGAQCVCRRRHRRRAAKLARRNPGAIGDAERKKLENMTVELVDTIAAELTEATLRDFVRKRLWMYTRLARQQSWR